MDNHLRMFDWEREVSGPNRYGLSAMTLKISFDDVATVATSTSSPSPPYMPFHAQLNRKQD